MLNIFTDILNHQPHPKWSEGIFYLIAKPCTDAESVTYANRGHFTVLPGQKDEENWDLIRLHFLSECPPYRKNFIWRPWIPFAMMELDQNKMSEVLRIFKKSFPKIFANKSYPAEMYSTRIYRGKYGMLQANSARLYMPEVEIGALKIDNPLGDMSKTGAFHEEVDREIKL